MDEYFETLRFAPLPGSDDLEYEGGGKKKKKEKPCRKLDDITDRLRVGLPRGPALDPDIVAKLVSCDGVTPVYNYIGTLDRMDKLLHVPGTKGYYCALYIIQFPEGSRFKGYSGESGDLRERMMQHRRCARAFGLNLADYAVFAWFCPHLTDKQRRACEKAQHTSLRPAQVISNVINEVSLELEQWEAAAAPW